MIEKKVITPSKLLLLLSFCPCRFSPMHLSECDGQCELYLHETRNLPEFSLYRCSISFLIDIQTHISERDGRCELELGSVYMKQASGGASYTELHSKFHHWHSNLLISTVFLRVCLHCYISVCEISL